MEHTILIIDDDSKLQALLKEYLEGNGYAVTSLTSGEGAIETINHSSPAIIILDVMMPGQDGFEVLRSIRAVSAVPVIMLTAKGDDTDRIVGLEMGADDYMPKPFNARELLARIKAVLRRKSPEQPRPVTMIVEAAGLTLDTARQELVLDGKPLPLAPTETKLMATLMRNPNQEFSREELMQKVWGREFTAFDRSIDVHISKLRHLLKPYPTHKHRIRTVWGKGYMFLDD